MLGQQVRLALVVGALVLLEACVTGGFRSTSYPPPQGGWAGGGAGGVPPYYAQSCMSHPLACSPAGASGEILGATAEKLVETVEVIQGLITLKDFLDEAEVTRVEEVLVQCAKEADRKINEQEYGPGKYPSDAECNRVVRYEGKKAVTQGMELGTMKHAAAFACVERELGAKFSDHLTQEPRYGQDPSTGRYAITDEPNESLVPDIVLHLVGDANKIQFLYDFLFPVLLGARVTRSVIRG